MTSTVQAPAAIGPNELIDGAHHILMEAIRALVLLGIDIKTGKRQGLDQDTWRMTWAIAVQIEEAAELLEDCDKPSGQWQNTH